MPINKRLLEILAEESAGLTHMASEVGVARIQREVIVNELAYQAMKQQRLADSLGVVGLSTAHSETGELETVPIDSGYAKPVSLSDSREAYKVDI